MFETNNIMKKTETSELKDKLILALEVLRPHLQADGGDIEIVEVTNDFIIKVLLHGACKNCPKSVNALKGGITQYFKSIFPEIKKVIAVNV